MQALESIKDIFKHKDYSKLLWSLMAYTFLGVPMGS
jgi:hypothetical protein